MEIIGWLQIVASPLLFGTFIGAFIYFRNPSATNLIIALLLILTGLIVGILYATKIWKTKGTMSFLSNVSATPDFDEKEPQNKSAKKSNFTPKP
nr:hypothetical protein [uncultured Flavobacterium sp.]